MRGRLNSLAGLIAIGANWWASFEACGQASNTSRGELRFAEHPTRKKP